MIVLQNIPIKLSDIWKQGKDGLIIYSDTLGNLHRYTFNPEASIIWDQVDGKNNVQSIVEIVAEQIGLDRKEVDEPVVNFLLELSSKKLIHIEEPKEKTSSTPLNVPPVSLPKSISKILFFVPANSKYLPPESLRISENSAPPLGMLTVAAALESAGIEIKVVDLAINQEKAEKILDYIEEFKPDIVGASILTAQHEAAVQSFCLIKKQFPALITVAGGIHATSDPESLLSTGALDYLVIGEGEYVMQDLISFLQGELKNIPKGVMAKQKDYSKKWIYGGKRNSIEKIDDLPEPARHLIEMDKYLQKGAIIASRGCTYSCKWCSGVTSNLHRYRNRSIVSIIAEMQNMNRLYSIDHFHFQDDNFTVDIERAYNICNHLAPFKYIWSCQGTICEIHNDLKSGRGNLLETMYRAGCHQIFFGIESGSDTLIKVFKKGVSKQATLEVIEAAQASGIETVSTSFIIGHPEDTEETIKETQEFIKELRDLQVYVSVAMMTPFPGSLIHDKADTYGVKIVNRDFSKYLYPNVNISTPNLSLDQLRNAYFETLEIIHRTYAQ